MCDRWTEIIGRKSEIDRSELVLQNSQMNLLEMNACISSQSFLVEERHRCDE